MSRELEEHLANRKWPEKSSRGDLFRGMKEPRVSKGRVFNRELRLYMGVSEAIRPGESAITALTTAASGHVYGVTRGQRAHLFYYNTDPHGDGIVDCRFFDGVRAAGNALVALGERVYGGVSEYDDCHDGGFLFAYQTSYDRFVQFHSLSGSAEQLATPLPGEGIATLAAAGGGKYLVGLSTRTATVFVYEIEPGSVRLIDRPDGLAEPCPLLAGGLDGKVYGVACGGDLVCIDAEKADITKLDLRLPRGEGASCATVDPVTGVIYFGSEPEGALVAFDPAAKTIRDLGSPPPAPPIRAMTVGCDGHVYGVTGPRDNLCLMFEADPQAGTIEELGVLFAANERYWHGYEFDAACTGRHGEIYFGEADRISHLFLYFPPQPERSR